MSKAPPSTTEPAAAVVAVGETVFIRATVEKVLDDGSLQLAVEREHGPVRIIAPADAVKGRDG
jgi:hypothetical protein